MSSAVDPPAGALDDDFLLLAESLPQVVWTARPDGKVDYVSRDFYAGSGREPVDLTELGWAEFLHPDDRQRCTERWAACVASGTDYTIEFRVWAPQEKTYRWHFVSAKAIRDPNGAIKRWFGTTIDVHDRRLAEDALRDRERHLRAIVDAQPICVKIVDADGLVLDMNPAGLALVEAANRDEVVGQHLDRLLHPNDREAYWTMHERVLTGVQERWSFRVIGRAGSQRWMETNASPLKSHVDKPSALCVTRDITAERRDAELRTAEIRVLNLIGSGAPLADVFDFITGFVDELLPGAMSSIVLVDDQQRMRVQSAPQVPPAYNHAVDGLRADGTDGVYGSCGAAMLERRTVVTSDIETDPRWERLRGIAAECGLRAAWSTPVFDAAHAVVGTFAVYYASLTTPTQAEIGLIERVAHFVTVAIERTRQSAQLRDSEQRYRSVYQGVPASIWEHDWSGVAALCAELDRRNIPNLQAYLEAHPEFVDRAQRAIRLVDVNDVTLRLLGADSREELYARRSEIFARVEPASFVETLCAYIEGSPGHSGERTLVTLDGELRHVLMNIAFPPPDRRDQLVLVTLIDITPRRAAELALAESESKFREIAETIGEAFWIAAPDMSTVHYISPAYERIWGLRAADLYHQPRQWYDAMLVEDRPSWDRAIEHFDPDGQTVEYRIRRPDGEIRWIEDTFFGVVDQDGDVSRAVGVAKDITTQKIQESRLQESEERFRLIAQATSDVILDWDLLTDQLWWNEGMRTHFGHATETLPADPTSWTRHLHEQDRARVLDSFAQALANSAADWSEEYRFVRADGSVAVVSDRRFVLRDKGGRARRVLGSLVDVTEQRQLEAQLRQSQRLDAIGQLTGGIAHDFNNLLTVILGNAETLSNELAANTELQTLATMSEKAARRGAELIQRLLAFSRRQALAPRATDIDELIDNMTPLLRRALGAPIEIAVTHGAAHCHALVDAAQLESAVLNLCLNARDAMPRGGQLDITTATVAVDETHRARATGLTPGDYVELVIADTGTGMDNETLTRAFEPFFTTKEPGSGSGLGLSMVYGFVNQSQGALLIDSAPGHGSTIRLYLPCTLRTEAPPAPSPAPLDRGREHILLVEDDPLVRQHVRTQLAHLGYDVTVAADANEALAALDQDSNVDLLFTDMIMPGGMNGRELAAAVHSHHPEMPILFTSGYTNDTFAAADDSGETLRLLQKPYRREELAAAVRAALDGA